jgi:hypothetical protein
LKAASAYGLSQTLRGVRFSLTAEAGEAFRSLYIRLVRRRRFFGLYAKRSLRKALAYASIGFVSGYVAGLQATQALNIAILSGAISAVAHFLHQILG